MTDAVSSPIPVTLLTGFLGSGKTTLLNYLLQQPALSRTLVIINEFGAIALDHMLVAHSTENLVMEMGSGCVCCTVRSDLIRTLRDVPWRFSRGGRRQFDRVIIETTGLADPAPILHTLMTHPQLAGCYQLDGVVVTVDLVHGLTSLVCHESARRQVGLADCLLLTKGDLADASRRSELDAMLAEINPAAVRKEVHHGEMDADILLSLNAFPAVDKTAVAWGWLRAEGEQAGRAHAHEHLPAVSDLVRTLHSSHHGDAIQAHAYTLDQPVTEAALLAWQQYLVAHLGHRLLRVKGIVALAGSAHPAVLHAVRHRFAPLASLPDWPGGAPCTRLVVITGGLLPAEARQLAASLRLLA